MADNPKSLASLADELEHGLTPAEMERVCRYVASKGWQGNLPFMRATLAAIEDAGFAVVPREAAAALRAPTIAADRGIGFAFVLVKRFQELSSAAVLGSFEFNERGKAWLQEAFDYADTLATPSPTIAAPSPSNEPAVEWVMCAVRDAMREHNFVVERGSDLWNRLRRHIEAALKARKPADDGAGQ